MTRRGGFQLCLVMGAGSIVMAACCKTVALGGPAWVNSTCSLVFAGIAVVSFFMAGRFSR